MSGGAQGLLGCAGFRVRIGFKVGFSQGLAFRV